MGACSFDGVRRYQNHQRFIEVFKRLSNKDNEYIEFEETLTTRASIFRNIDVGLATKKKVFILIHYYKKLTMTSKMK